jgi:coenzyme PQQ precursor peptide PqqA
MRNQECYSGTKYPPASLLNSLASGYETMLDSKSYNLIVNVKYKFEYKYREISAMWTKPSYQKIRLGFEVTMYFKSV